MLVQGALLPLARVATPLVFALNMDGGEYKCSLYICPLDMCVSASVIICVSVSAMASVSVRRCVCVCVCVCARAGVCGAYSGCDSLGI